MRTNQETMFAHASDCPDCGGTGRTEAGDVCPTCSGTGKQAPARRNNKALYIS